MPYIVRSYGLAEDEDRKFRSRERALQFIGRKVRKWCRENEVSIDEDTDFNDGDDYFYYGMEDRGVCIYRMYEVPKFASKAEELLWEAKIEMDMADNAAEEYKWTLTECGVSDHVYAAKACIDKALAQMSA